MELDLKHKAKQAAGQKKKRRDQCHWLCRAATSLPVAHHPSLGLITPAPQQAHAPALGLITPAPHSYLLPPGMKVVLEMNKVFGQQ